MAVKLGDAFVALGVKEDDLDRGLNRARGRVNTFLRDITTGIGQGLGQALAQGVGNIVRASIDRIDDSINKASDLRESINRVTVVFGESSDEILAWSKTTNDALGQSRQQALEAAGDFGNMLTSMGSTREEAAKMSVSLVELASDLASFNNIDPALAFEKLRSGIAGELEPVRALGIDLSELRVQAKALELGLADTTREITQQDKVLARYQIIMEQTKNAQGDFARNSDELANSQRILAAQIEDSAARFGQALLPVRLAFVRGLSDLVRVVQPYGENIMDSLAAGLARGIVSILPVLQQVRALFSYWLKPGSPPRLLKEIDEWGKGAMQAYLDGWSLADFDALRSAGGMIENVVRSFAGSGDIKETDLVSRVFGTQRAMTQAIRDFRQLGQVSEATLGSIADAAGPAGSEVAGLVREYFELQRATSRVSDAQSELNGITDRYAQALNPLQGQLDAVRRRQQEVRDNQRLEELGEIIRDPRADADDRQLARLEAEEIQLERQARALETERDAAVDGAQAKIDAAKKEEDAQRSKYEVAQAALDQQTRTNALIEEEASLRERLANEALAAQEKAIRDLEAEQRKAEQTERERLAGLERIADAQLRYNLASSDTAGQLDLMRAELAKVAVGSADYFDILTQIVGLEERLQKERDSAPGGLFAPILDAVGSGGEVEQASAGIQALSDALDQAFKALAGTDGREVELSPYWSNVAEAVKTAVSTIGGAIADGKLIIGDFINFFNGESGDSGSTSDILRPTYNNGIFGTIYTAVTTVLTTLRRIFTGDWQPLWNDFKNYVTNLWGATDSETNPLGWSILDYIVNNFIPALEALGDGEWREAWEALGGKAVESLLAGFTVGLAQLIVDLKTTDLLGRTVTEALKSMWPDDWSKLFPDAGGGGTPGQPGAPFDLNALLLQALQDALRGAMPMMPIQPQSFGGDNFPGIAPQTPLMPVAAGGSVSGDTNIYQIEQHIATNGDFGGARQGANEGIRQALLSRRLQGA